MKPATHSKNLIIGLLCCVLSVSLYSMKPILVKSAHNFSEDNISLMVVRVLVSALIFALILLFRRQAVKRPKNCWHVLFTLALGSSLYHVGTLLNYVGLNFTSATIEPLVFSLVPSAVLFFRIIFEKWLPNKIQLMSVALNMLGVLSVAFTEVHFFDNYTYGIALLVASMTISALYIYGSQPLVKSLGVTLFTSLSIFGAAITVSLTHSGAIVEIFHIIFAEFHFEKIIFFGVMLAVFCTVLPSMLAAKAISSVGPMLVSLVGSFGFFVTVIFSAVFLDETITAIHLFGGTLVISSVLILIYTQNA